MAQFGVFPRGLILSSQRGPDNKVKTPWRVGRLIYPGALPVHSGCSPGVTGGVAPMAVGAVVGMLGTAGGPVRRPGPGSASKPADGVRDALEAIAREMQTA